MIRAVLAVAYWALPMAAAGPEIEKAWIGADGQVQVQSGGKIKSLAKDPDQVSVQALVIAPDRQSVGWLVEMPNCCTSYPIPMTLVIHRAGQKPLRLGGSGLAIWGWAFRTNGSQVGFYTGTVHGDYTPNFQLHDTRTVRLIDTWVGREELVAPEWARGLKPR